MMPMNIMIGERYSHKLMKPLELQGFHVILMPDNPYVDKRLAGHVDLSAIRIDNTSVVVSLNLGQHSAIVNYLTNRGYKVFIAENEQSKTYPNDSILCACIIGKYMIHNKNITDSTVKLLFRGKYIHVNQGYANCTICSVDESSVITSDNGIAGTLVKEGFSVRIIEQGIVKLDGFDYGFIGGASFATDDSVYFTGRFPDGTTEVIESFINSKNKRVIYLTDEPAFDIGGALLF